MPVTPITTVQTDSRDVALIIAAHNAAAAAIAIPPGSMSGTQPTHKEIGEQYPAHFVRIYRDLVKAVDDLHGERPNGHPASEAVP